MTNKIIFYVKKHRVRYWLIYYYPSKNKLVAQLSPTVGPQRLDKAPK